MHVQIVNFGLKDLSDADFRRLCDDLAPNFAAIPGMTAKVWLADPATNTYGGVYLWRDRQAMEAFAAGDLFRAVATNPNFAAITSRDFEVLEEPTRITHGMAAVPA